MAPAGQVRNAEDRRIRRGSGGRPEKTAVPAIHGGEQFERGRMAPAMMNANAFLCQDETVFPYLPRRRARRGVFPGAVNGKTRLPLGERRVPLERGVAFSSARSPRRGYGSFHAMGQMYMRRIGCRSVNGARAFRFGYSGDEERYRAPEEGPPLVPSPPTRRDLRSESAAVSWKRG
jgi:hypothetical protein